MRRCDVIIDHHDNVCYVSLPLFLSYISYTLSCSYFCLYFLPWCHFCRSLPTCDHRLSVKFEMASTQDPEKHIFPSPAHSTQGVDEISPVSSNQLDDNYELYKDGKDIEADPAELKRVLRKIDLRIIPVLFVTYLLQYLDKNSINFASVYGLQKGTHLVGQDYSWLGMLLKTRF